MGRRIIGDLTGMRFGRWTIIKKFGKKDKNKSIYWLCRCDCGKEKEVLSFSLFNGDSTSCGCYQRSISSEKNLNDLTGKKFGRWTVLYRVENDKSGASRWMCQCDCGKEIEVRGTNLRDGTTESCGCLQKKIVSEVHKIEYGLSAKKNVYDSYKRQAKRRDLLFELIFEQFLNLTQQSCHYCGSEPSNFSKGNGNGSFTYNGIDRVDNNQGYIIENCVPCCWNCGRAKNNLSYDEFIEWGKRLGNYLNNMEVFFNGKCKGCSSSIESKGTGNFKAINSCI